VSKIFYLERYKDFVGENRTNGTVDLYRNFLPWLLKRGEKISFFDVGVPTPDLGTPDRLRRFGRKN